MKNQIMQSMFGPVVLVFTCILLGAGQIASAQSSPPEAAAAHNRSVLITGANRGIGLEFARQHSAAGWRVIGTAREPDAAAELHALSVDVVQLDVTDPSSVDRLARDLAGTPIDLLINNAGIQPLMWKLAEVDFDAFQRALAVNTVGPVRVTRAPLQVNDSVRAMLGVIDRLSPADNGTFQTYAGERMAW